MLLLRFQFSDASSRRAPAKYRRFRFALRSFIAAGADLIASSANKRTLALISLGTVWLLWGSTYIGIRLAVQTIPPLLMAGARFTIAGVLLCGGLLFWKRSLVTGITKVQWSSIAVTAFLLIVCGNGLVCIAEQHLASGSAAVIAASVPIWVLILISVLDRRRPATSAILGVALGMFGITIVIGLNAQSMSIPDEMLILVAALCWAIGSVYTSRIAHSLYNPLITGLEMMIGGAMMISIALASGDIAHVHWSDISERSWLAFIWLVGAGSMIGYTAYGYAVRNLPAHVTSTHAYVNPIIAVCLGTVMGGEALTHDMILGGAMVVLSLFTILARN